MVDGVANHVYERVADRVEDIPVELDVRAVGGDGHLLAAPDRDVPCQLGQGLPDGADRLQACVHHAVAKAARELSELLHLPQHLQVAALRRQLSQLVAAGDQLADEAYEVVDGLYPDPDRAGDVGTSHVGHRGFGRFRLALGAVRRWSMGDWPDPMLPGCIRRCGERGQECGVVPGALSTGRADVRHIASERVDHRQQRADHRRRQVELTGAHERQDIFPGVRDALDTGKRQESGCTLDRVDAPEQAIDLFGQV